ncbi:MAG: hypothetical protein H7222_12670 [Methylotenera sp.]|nr:hypothetical protein [Oligoflexia bacterium]
MSKNEMNQIGSAHDEVLKTAVSSGATSVRWAGLRTELGTGPLEKSSGEVLTHHEDSLAGISRKWRDALFSPPVDLKTDLEKILFLTTEADTTIEYRSEALSGYNLKAHSGDELTDAAQIRFTPLFNGGFLIQKSFQLAQPSFMIFEHYDFSGAYQGRIQAPPPTPLYVPLTEMEPACPIASHLYNTLAFEYEQAETGTANSRRILGVETLLRTLATLPALPFSFRRGFRDLALVQLQKKLLQNELDPALTFQEKEVVRLKIKSDRALILKTKARIHRQSALKLKSALFVMDLSTRFQGIFGRPQEKVRGGLYKYTIGAFLWFFGVVKGNIGYSIALAIYGPFTFYFITQPMNPYAMWAVGKVRQGYINTINDVKTLQDSSSRVLQHVTGLGASGGTAAALLPEPLHTQNADPAHSSVAPSPVQNATPALPLVTLNRYSSFKPRFENLLLATDVPDVDKQKWPDRMSNFKAMQIAYEENMQFSTRMGRLEQMETQLNFPLIAESSFRQMERYQDLLMKMRSKLARHPQAAELKTYFDREEQRTRQFKLYVWDKLIRYMLDHPYVVMNEGKDQNYVDYYVGRSFIFLEEVTASLTKEYQGLRKPKGYAAVEKLAGTYRDRHVDAPSIEERLAKNSLLATQKDFYGSNELRSYLKRQWELLFLSQNRAQEASNFGLQTYTWSVRNAIWALDALHSSKIHELRMIGDAVDQHQKLDAAINEEKKNVESLYESLFHIMSLEYVSIRQELSERLDDDIEFIQRQTVIESLKQSFTERTQFLKSLAKGTS